MSKTFLPHNNMRVWGAAPRCARRYKNPEIQDSELFERGQLRAKKVAELEAKAATEGLDNAVEVCKCGYHQIWHQGRATLDSLDLEMTSRSDLSSLTAPRPRSSPSESLPARALISQSRWPQKDGAAPSWHAGVVPTWEGEAVVSAGRLSLKKVGSAVLAATFSSNLHKALAAAGGQQQPELVFSCFWRNMALGCEGNAALTDKDILRLLGYIEQLLPTTSAGGTDAQRYLTTFAWERGPRREGARPPPKLSPEVLKRLAAIFEVILEAR
eukprot:g17759.t1